MSSEENIKTVIHWMEVVNQKDLDAIDKLADEIYAADYVYHDPGFPNFEPGPEPIKQFIRQILKDYPDLHSATEDIFAVSDKVASRGVITGMHATTGETLNLQWIGISRFSGGKIVEEWQVEVPVPIKG